MCPGIWFCFLTACSIKCFGKMICVHLLEREKKTNSLSWKCWCWTSVLGMNSAVQMSCRGSPTWPHMMITWGDFFFKVLVVRPHPLPIMPKALGGMQASVACQTPQGFAVCSRVGGRALEWRFSRCILESPRSLESLHVRAVCPPEQ